LAKARGEEHIGDNAAQIINAKAKKKAKLGILKHHLVSDKLL
jgi:hypothetical protein